MDPIAFQCQGILCEIVEPFRDKLTNPTPSEAPSQESELETLVSNL